MPFYVYNTLTRTKEAFRPIRPGEVGIYTCGPTVYNFAHIGNLRTYLFEDILKRVLAYNGFRVRHVMNITDVGHLAGDRDMGEDKMEKGARREGKSAWDIAEFYTRAFRQDIARLNILEPDIWCKATESIPEQIDLIRALEEKGTRQTSERNRGRSSGSLITRVMLAPSQSSAATKLCASSQAVSTEPRSFSSFRSACA